MSKDAYLKSLNEQFCNKCSKITIHRGNSCVVCRGKNAVNKMIQYGKENPIEEKEHRLNCAKAANNFWKENPEFRKENAANNIIKWNKSEEGKKFSIIHCSELGKIWGPINLAKLNSKEIKFCNKCNKITVHNGFCVCLICNPKACMITQEYCKECNLITPHDFKDECQVCNKEKIWCNHCQKFETIIYNSVDLHWIFYKSKTNSWIRDFPEQVQLLEDNIIGISKLQNNIISGIYCWLINGTNFYIGQSADISSRSYDHMFEMFNSPEYWNNIANNLGKNILEIKVLEECGSETIDERELYWINKFQPASQKCDGTDSIKSLGERKIIKLF